MNKYVYFANCVNWPGDAFETDGLSDMIDNQIEIKRDTFLKHVNHSELKNIERNLDYAAHPKQGLTMASDWHVSYHRSKLYGKRTYYLRHSGIEYVFKNC